MQIVDGPKSTIYALAFSPSGGLLVIGTSGGDLWAVDPVGHVRHPLGENAFPPIQCLAYSPEGETLLAATAKGWFPVDVTDDANWHVPAVHDNPTGVTALGYLGRERFAVGSGSRVKPAPGVLQLWDGYRLRTPYFQEPAGVRAVATHPASGLVAWANYSRRVTVWDVTKPDQFHFNLKQDSPSISFHPGGKLLAAAADYNVHVYDIDKRHEVASWKGHTARVTGVAFSPDGRTLATGGRDEAVRLWDAASFQETACFRWPVGKVYSLAYAPDGLRLAAGGDKGSVVVWDAG